MTIISAFLTILLSVGWGILLMILIVVPFVIVPAGLFYVCFVALSSAFSTTIRELKAYKELSKRYGPRLTQNEINSLFSNSHIVSVVV